MSTNVLEINGLSKRYKKVQALDNLSLTVRKGTIFGILGPNGSGKTTTLGILLGVIRQSSGTFSWFGNGDSDVSRTRIGALLETPNFYPYLSAERNLRITAKIKQLKHPEERIGKVLKIVDLYDRRNSRFRTFSLGMKQRLAIAAALLNDPEVLVLDEPTNGLDPQGIAEIRNLIRKIASDGTTILLASHQLDEVEKVCTDVVILRKGVKIREGKIGELMHATHQILVAAEETDRLSTLIDQMPGISRKEKTEHGFLLEVPEHMNSTQLNKYFFENGIVLSELREVRRSLEDQFLEIIQQ